jgi:hypothetical protein
MRGFFSSCLILCTAYLLSSALANAQPVQPGFPQLEIGEEVADSFDADEADQFYGTSFRVYRIEVVGDQRYLATLSSSAFQSHLLLMRPVGGLTEIIRDDVFADEAGTARLRFRVDAAGTYLLVARPLEEGADGRFTLRIEELPPPEPAVARRIAVGEIVTGALSAASALYLTESNSEVLHDLYHIDLVEGQVVDVSMESDEVDAFVEFGPISGDSIESTDFDDDSGEGLNAVLRVQITSDGTYGIVARSFGEDEHGSYSLRVTERVARRAARSSIQSGVLVESALSDEDADLPDGASYQEWIYDASAGETVQVRMRSEYFDTFLYLGHVVDGDFVLLAENDDAPDDGTNSLIEHTFAEAGEYVIRTSSLWRGQAGAYTIEISSE